ncbi:MAG TPA: hypothetical protein VKW76_04880, partial [Candidatus Binatia bacterium]|nr:hypothetical protein [Candidatus Binatia bacterium]
DIRALLDAVLRDGTVAGVRVDPSRIGIAGHSLGGYTALGVGGAWPSWRDGRIRAVLALSPYAQPFLAGGGLAGLKVPVMYQGGTRDIGITPGVRKNAGAFDRTGGPKYYVEFEGTGHLGWTDLVDGHHDLMVRYALAFFDHVLRDRPEATLEEKLPGVSDLRADPGGPSSR